MRNVQACYVTPVDSTIHVTTEKMAHTVRNVQACYVTPRRWLRESTVRNVQACYVTPVDSTIHNTTEKMAQRKHSEKCASLTPVTQPSTSQPRRWLRESTVRNVRSTQPSTSQPRRWLRESTVRNVQACYVTPVDSTIHNTTEKMAQRKHSEKCASLLRNTGRLNHPQHNREDGSEKAQ